MSVKTLPRQVDGEWDVPAAGTFDVIDPSDARAVVPRVAAMPPAEITELYYPPVQTAQRWRDTLPIEPVQTDVAVRTASAS